MNPNLERGILLYQQSRYELAEAELRQVLASEPHNAYAHSLLALCLCEREQFQDATGEAQQAVQFAPDFAFAHYALAKIWHKRNYPTEALAAINEALRLDASDADYFALLAAIYLGESQWSEALIAAERGLQLDADHITCTNLRAIALVKLGRKSEAGTTIDSALRRNPENPVSHANQGWTLLEQNDPQRALEHFREALRLDPQNEWARQGIVEALKARNFIYAIMLRYFLFMAKFSPRGRWMIILGAYFGNQILGAMAKTNPDLSPWIWPLRILYLLFVMMTWMASPFFNLLLRLNRFGRMALTPDQTVASNWFGLVLLPAVLSLAACFFYGFNSVWAIVLAVFGFLLLPITGVFRCPAGPARQGMAIYTALVAATGFSVIGVFLSADSQPDPKSRIETGFDLFDIFLVGAVASSWIVNIVRTRRQRR